MNSVARQELVDICTSCGWHPSPTANFVALFEDKVVLQVRGHDAQVDVDSLQGFGLAARHRSHRGAAGRKV